MQMLSLYQLERCLCELPPVSALQAACLARCNGAHVDLQYQDATGLAAFRHDVEAACTGTDKHIILSYSRKAFQQTGHLYARSMSPM